jgi:agmatinase
VSHDTFAFLTSPGFGGFLNAPTPEAHPNARFTVVGIAWDGATTNRPGSRFGPAAIRRASHMLCDAHHPWLGVSPRPWVADLGDLALPNTSLAGMRSALEAQAAHILATHPHPVWLGGDHSVTLSLLRAYRQREGKPLALVHFDAHCDTWEDHFGEPSGHGTWVHEAVVEGLIDPIKTVQVGIRSAAIPSAANYIRDRGGLIYTGRDLRGLHNTDQLKQMIDGVKQRIGAEPVYLSFDIDSLDPAYAPGTGTPEPGGLSSGQALCLLEEWHSLNWIGMDCCEVSPPYDHAELTSLAAATLVWTYLSGRSAQSDTSSDPIR